MCLEICFSCYNSLIFAKFLVLNYTMNEVRINKVSMHEKIPTKKKNKSILVPLQCGPYARWVAGVSCFTVQDCFINAVRGIIRDRYQDVVITCVMKYDVVLCVPKRLGQKRSFSELTFFLKEIRLNIVLKTDRKSYILRRLVLLPHF